MRSYLNKQQENKPERGGEMSQWVKALVTKTNNRDFDPGTHVVEGEK